MSLMASSQERTEDHVFAATILVFLVFFAFLIALLPVTFFFHLHLVLGLNFIAMIHCMFGREAFEFSLALACLLSR